MPINIWFQLHTIHFMEEEIALQLNHEIGDPNIIWDLLKMNLMKLRNSITEAYY